MISSEMFLGAMYQTMTKKALKAGKLTEEAYERLKVLPHRTLNEQDIAFKKLQEELKAHEAISSNRHDRTTA